MNVDFRDEDKILIIAPHQDDETIGCGGLLIKYGDKCDIMLLSDGRHGTSKNFPNEEELIEIRNKEFKNALSFVSVNNIYHLEIEDGYVKKNIKKIRKYNLRRYSYIFVPNRYESHEDHNCVLREIKKIKLLQGLKVQIYEYEVWTPLRNPTWILDISNVIKTKEKMLASYGSQLCNKDYLKSSIGLNMYRGVFSNYEYAEAFCNSDYSDFLAGIYRKMPSSLRDYFTKLYKRINIKFFK